MLNDIMGIIFAICCMGVCISIIITIALVGFYMAYRMFNVIKDEIIK
jgi:hypothetical protein